MNDRPDDLASLYHAALREHLAGRGEQALHQAYELGRAALGHGLGVVELALLHHDAVSGLLQAPRPDGDSAVMAHAAAFLAECLSPFEMMLRGYQETNAQLSAANADLTQAHAAVAAAHEALKAEVGERERAEAALVHGQKLQAVGVLAGGVAHHFNNLLTIVLGNLQLAQRRAKAGEDIDRHLLSAMKGVERGAEVVKQLLTFSRQQVLETRVIDVAEWMNGASALLSSGLRGDIALKVGVARPLWPIRTDPAQLELALLNLAMNARDAMPDGGTLHISAANRHVDDDRLGLYGDYVVIEVVDTGQGVDPEILPRVFEPFFTTKTVVPGAGLGLSQVHGFVNQSGGAVDLRSVVGQGATFTIYLPATPEAKEAGDAPAADKAPESPMRVLVVDDDVDVADMAGQLLESCGYVVKRVHRARAALELLGAGDPIDLVFSDIIMPGGMSGVQLAEEVRRRFPGLPILLTTGYSDALPHATAKGLPIIFKPYDSAALCGRVGELIRLGGNRRP